MAWPMYRTIADDLLQKIESGELKPGGQLKTKVELRDFADTSPAPPSVLQSRS